eukprot:5958553-Alexandrium_andersonii.AAC.1
MSASLVGSEMCIRDRRRPSVRTPPLLAVVWAGGHVPAGGARPPGGGAGPGARQHSGCLLYTSPSPRD